MSPGWIIAVAAAGAVAGPLQRALIFACAVPAGQPLRTCCPGCGRRVLPGGHRFPAALWVGGRCPGCDKPAGLRPFLPEALTAVTFALLAIPARPAPVLAASCLLAAGGITLAFIDAAVHRLPDLLTLPLFAGVIMLLTVAAGTGHQWPVLLRAVLAGAGLACFYLLVLLVTPAGIGAGDAKLALAVGTMLGWYGWAALFAGTFCAFLASAAYALGLLAFRRISPRARFAFGPFMLAGALAAILATPLLPAVR